jgi:hypothetical protein
MHVMTVDEAAENPTQDQPDVNRDVELLLASANAIQRLVAERGALCSRVAVLEREVDLLRQAHNSYRTVATEFVTQFQVIEGAVGKLFSEPSSSSHRAVKVTPLPSSLGRL